MRDAMGGSVVLVIIVVFIVFALGYMAFNVNYTKAFRMKNKIIALYEDYEGECLGDCKDQIKKYAAEIGYSSGNDFSCPAGYSEGLNMYCYKRVETTKYTGKRKKSDISDDLKTKVYYKIITKINVEVPVINNILDLRIFYITGDTKAFEV